MEFLGCGSAVAALQLAASSISCQRLISQPFARTTGLCSAWLVVGARADPQFFLFVACVCRLGRLESTLHAIQRGDSKAGRDLSVTHCLGVPD